MSKSNSTRTTIQSKSKPERPDGSPLFWHKTGRWCKKIRGRFVYFGRGSHDEALTEYERQKDDLHSGRIPREEDEVLTVHGLCYKFLETKKHLRDTGELSPHTFRDYALVCQLLQKLLGKSRLVSDLGPSDWEKARRTLAKNWGPVRVGNTINKIRIVFNYAFKNGLLDRPLVYGEGFKRPSKKALRKHRQAQGPRMFEACEICVMLERATLPLRAMILLGINCGFGNSDVGSLPMSAVDLDAALILYPRPKTAIERRIPLWPETIQALRDWLAIRPEPVNEDHNGLMFITSHGGSWAKETNDNPVSKETAKLLKELMINGNRNFYTLRHTFQTIADEAGDFIATRKIMGHASNDIADVYRERVSDERLRKVTAHVRAWLFSDPAGRGEEPDIVRFPTAKIG
jgi:integrase